MRQVPGRTTTHRRDSIEAHLSIVFAALAVSRLVERATGWSIARFVKTLRRYHTVTIGAGDQTITAADPLPSPPPTPYPTTCDKPSPSSAMPRMHTN